MTNVTWDGIEHHVNEILRQLAKSKWRPDYVVGLTRGGLIPATLISHYLGCRLETLKVKLRDGVEEECESNLWMAEDAFGYVSIENRGDSGTETDPAYRKNILIVDDINDSGATLNWIKNDWQSGCMPNSPAWDAVWRKNVRVAVLYDNAASDSNLVSYSAVKIDKSKNPEWINFPWENWWRQ